MPKQIPRRELGAHNISIGYTKRFPPPGPVNDDIQYVSARHSFGFTFKSTNHVALLDEKLIFDKVLYIGEALRHKTFSPNIDEASCAHPAKPSEFGLINQSGKSSYVVDPPITEETFANYRTWLGLDRFSSVIKDTKSLENFLAASSRVVKPGREHVASAGPKTNRRLLTDRAANTICDFSPEFKMFLECIESTKRYDLLLNELRREQAPSESPDLTKAGQNLPAALRKLSTNKVAYSRLKATFESVAPHIISMRSTQLRTGSEFVEFIESRGGRGIESWETSDGSLRALAILVAIETVQRGDTIVIEEPEQNLHPWAIRALIDHIREVINANSIQVIITTHSEHVLERAAPQEVLVASRSIELGTTYARVSDIVKKGPIEMGEVGRLWVKGILGGVPTA